jgi:hypothetical protein
MTITDLRTEDDYERALKEIEQYFENAPGPGTEAADRLNQLTARIVEYEDVHFPVSPGKEDAMAEDDFQRAHEDLVRRFEQGLMLASDKDRILALLRSRPAADVTASERYEFPYLRTFDAICAAVEVLSVAGESPARFSISVVKFQKAFNEHRDAKASPIRFLLPAEISPQYAAELGRQVDELESESAQLPNQLASTSFERQLYPEAATVCAELYQVIGCLAEELGVFAHPDVQRALDNASQHKLVHRDLLPWPKLPLRPESEA